MTKQHIKVDTTRLRSKDKGHVRRHNTLAHRREDRLAEEQRVEQEAQEAAADDDPVDPGISNLVGGVDLKAELKAERAKVTSLECTLLEIKEEQAQLLNELQSFREATNANPSTSIDRDRLDVDSLRIALAQSDKTFRAQVVTLKEASESNAQLEAVVKLLKQENETLRVKGKSLLQASNDKEVNELSKQLRASGDRVEELEAKLLRVEGERDNCQSKLESTSFRAEQLEQEKRELELTVAKLPNASSRGQQSDPWSEQTPLKLEPAFRCPPLLEDFKGEIKKSLLATTTSGGKEPDSVFSKFESQIESLEVTLKDWRNALPSSSPTALLLQAKVVASVCSMCKLMGEELQSSKSKYEGMSSLNEELRQKILSQSLALAESDKDKIESGMSERGSELESAGLLAKRKKEKVLIQRLAQELSQSHSTITELRNENMDLLLRLSGVD